MVTQQQQTSTPMQEWVAQTLERMQPILDGLELTDRYFEVEKEAMRDILDRVEWLVQHFKVLPEPCDREQVWHDGYSCGVLDSTEDTKNKRTYIREVTE